MTVQTYEAFGHEIITDINRRSVFFLPPLPPSSLYNSVASRFIPRSVLNLTKNVAVAVVVIIIMSAPKREIK